MRYGIIRAWCRPPGSATGRWFPRATLALAGTAAGTLISAVARTEAVATAQVPLARNPQIILAGVVAPLGGRALWMAKGLVGVYWAQLALERLLPGADLRLLGRAEGGRVAPVLIVIAQAAAMAATSLVALARAGGRSGA